MWIKNGIYLSFTIFTSITFAEIVSESVLKTAIFTSSFLLFLIFKYQKETYSQKYLMDLFTENQILQSQKENFEKELLEYETKINQKNLKLQIEYQYKIGKCVFPYCEKDGEICLFHSRFKEAECPVCFETFSEKDIPLKCGHWIHMNCVFKSCKNICPLCKEKNILNF